MALYVTIYMSLMGKEGLKEAATISYDGAHYLCDKLIATGKARLVYDKPFFNEFLVDIDGKGRILRPCRRERLCARSESGAEWSAHCRYGATDQG